MFISFFLWYKRLCKSIEDNPYEGQQKIAIMNEAIDSIKQMIVNDLRFSVVLQQQGTTSNSSTASFSSSFIV